MIGEKTMKDMKKRILAQVYSSAEEHVERDLNIFFDEIRKLKEKITFLQRKESSK